MVAVASMGYDALVRRFGWWYNCFFFPSKNVSNPRLSSDGCWLHMHIFASPVEPPGCYHELVRLCTIYVKIVRWIMKERERSQIIGGQASKRSTWIDRWMNRSDIRVVKWTRVGHSLSWWPFQFLLSVVARRRVPKEPIQWFIYLWTDS